MVVASGPCPDSPPRETFTASGRDGDAERRELRTTSGENESEQTFGVRPLCSPSTIRKPPPPHTPTHRLPTTPLPVCLLYHTLVRTFSTTTFTTTTAVTTDLPFLSFASPPFYGSIR
ncbi:putative fungal zinc cluster transcription factor [Anopheles sinensis]|uniref:Putative fungal zinc cluster transcription factor n=1 Tax=Anopheles sinensis TaxID=74873 RepID=A0A084VGZ2_ANOSI|nr:putative fungal zinc cluster transcription factor [Anopheles sinensis]